IDRYEPDDTIVTLAASFDPTWSAAESVAHAGMRWPLDAGSLAAIVLATGRAARVDDYSGLQGIVGGAARDVAVGAGAAAPITVGGRLWGLIRIFSRAGTPLPDAIEAQLDGFTELVATALSNAQASDDLRGLANEQAALRRLATLVARGIGPEQVIRAVADEVSALLQADTSAIVRFDEGEKITVLVDQSGRH